MKYFEICFMYSDIFLISSTFSCTCPLDLPLVVLAWSIARTCSSTFSLEWQKKSSISVKIASIQLQQVEQRSTVARGAGASSLVSVRATWMNLVFRRGRVLDSFLFVMSARPWVWILWLFDFPLPFEFELLRIRSSRFLYIILGFGSDLDILSTPLLQFTLLINPIMPKQNHCH